MKNYLLILFVFVAIHARAQTPMQISGPDCNGISHDMFSELDAGKAVVVFFFMDACSSCPPVASAVQTMCNNVLASHPGLVTGYVMPYNNSTTCAATLNWVSSNSLPFYTPYDSGVVQVANYGGFGMPTVVLLGGKNSNRHVMFATLSFVASDTLTMRDSILNLLTPAAIHETADQQNGIRIYPNPVSDVLNVEMELSQAALLKIDLVDMFGRLVLSQAEQTSSGLIKKQWNTTALAAGRYMLRIQYDDQIINRSFYVSH